MSVRVVVGLCVYILTCVCVCPVMSFPAEGVESAIKNNIEDVRLFLDSRHAGHYAVYNLTKRSYRPSRFHNRVSALTPDPSPLCSLPPPGGRVTALQLNVILA